MDPIIYCVIAGALALVVAGLFARWILGQDQGTPAMREIAGAIKEGANAFLGREYRILGIFVVVVAIILAFIPNLGWMASVSFILGAVTSTLTGYLGMQIATRSNSRAGAAVQKSLNKGLQVAFRGGAIMGLSVVGVGLIGLSIIYFAFHGDVNFLTIIPAFGFGASGVALFARVGGGIYTKAADAGSDLAGKVEAGIPEDDPRNAAVIADLVGDNVGDVAGCGGDLYESYVESIIATLALSSVAVLASGSVKALVPDEKTAWFIPMLVAAVGIISSIIGVFLVRVREKASMSQLLNALRVGTTTASILAAVLSWVVVFLFKADMGIFWSILAGLVTGVLIGLGTDYYTSYAYKPTQNVAKSAQTGAGTVILSGFSNGLMSTLPSVILVAIATVLSYRFAGIYGVAIAGVGMLATLGIWDATDAYGPIADNAGGIAEMAGLPPEVRDKTDALDSLGNTTKATNKGFAIASAAITAIGLVFAYNTAVGISVADLSLLDARVVAGLLLGALMPAIFVAMTVGAVSRTTFAIINEVRRQFHEIKGLMEGTARPDYAKCVTICTDSALRNLIAPTLIAIIVPIVVGVIFGRLALGGFLIGATATGFILAITLANAGGSWDNAKKYVESGQFGGKGSDAHKAAVVGDTVGDPFKDTAGPSLNIMIKLMSIISLLLAPVLAHFTGLF